MSTQHSNNIQSNVRQEFFIKLAKELTCSINASIAGSLALWLHDDPNSGWSPMSSNLDVAVSQESLIDTALEVLAKYGTIRSLNNMGNQTRATFSPRKQAVFAINKLVDTSEFDLKVDFYVTGNAHSKFIDGIRVVDRALVYAARGFYAGLGAHKACRQLNDIFGLELTSKVDIRSGAPAMTPVSSCSCDHSKPQTQNEAAPAAPNTASEPVAEKVIYGTKIDPNSEMTEGIPTAIILDSLKTCEEKSKEQYKVAALTLLRHEFGVINTVLLLGEVNTSVMHAEENLIAAMLKNDQSPTDAVMFCTYSPCTACEKLLKNYNIKLYYVAEYKGKL